MATILPQIESGALDFLAVWLHTQLREHCSTDTAAASGDGSEITDGSNPPSIAALNEMVDQAVDPDIPRAEKIELVEGSEKDPAIFDELVKARAENSDVDWVLVNPVISAGPNKARVKVRIETAGNPPTNAESTIVYDDGRWSRPPSHGPGRPGCRPRERGG